MTKDEGRELRSPHWLVSASVALTHSRAICTDHKDVSAHLSCILGQIGQLVRLTDSVRSTPLLGEAITSGVEVGVENLGLTEANGREV